MEPFVHIISTPIGPLTIRGNEQCINALLFREEPPTTGSVLPDTLLQCMQELEEYFAGNRKVFTFPIHQDGTAFQQTVWEQLQTIPYGQTISYLQLAHRIHNPKSIRAVGTTNGRNRLSIVVPCHRVIGSNGSLTGYAGGIWRKKWLLEHEWRFSHGMLF